MLRTVERGILIAAAVTMALVPIEISVLGLAPLVVGVLVFVQILIRHRKRSGEGPIRA
jgi:hypothetical protein